MEEGAFERFADPTEQAVATIGRTVLDVDSLTDGRTWSGGETFTSDRKRMSVITSEPEGGNRLSLKGAPEVVLDLCTDEADGAGRVALSPERIAEWIDRIESMAASGQRLLAVASRSVSDRELRSVPAADLERELTLHGVIGMIDPLRPEATDAVREAHSAGIRVVMVTGDHPGTATEIAGEVGVFHLGDRVLTGTEVDHMPESEFAEAVTSTSVFARVTPAHKLRIVSALQDHGEICAMTGDGVNDAPGLKAADIGIAMGMGGTDVAKEAASMVLTDDNFATIVAAVREGRAIFQNIQSFLLYLLGSNAGEVLTVLLGVVFAGVLGLTGSDGATVVAPLLAVQILWINLLTDSAPALALGVDPPTGELMTRPPRKPGEGILTRPMWRRIALMGVVMAFVTLLTLDLYLPGGFFEGESDIVEARTAAFTVLVFTQLFNCFNARSLTTSAFSGLLSNLWLWAAIGLSVVLQVGVVHLEVLNDAFGTSPLDAESWVLAVVLASAVLWVGEAVKLATRRPVVQPAGWR
ncbi:MAG: cation-transporting P-type ATPase [Acidimicrobiales bacterium]|nr:cation-transporting P-type ATPase [Acidimicrobiales bacterium]